MTKRFEKIDYYGFKLVLLYGFGKEELRLMVFSITIANRWSYVCQIRFHGFRYCFVLVFLSLRNGEWGRLWYLIHEALSRPNQIMVSLYFESAKDYEWDDLLTIVLVPFVQIGLIGFDLVVENADFVFRILMGFALVLMRSHDWVLLGNFQKENYGLQDWEPGLQLYDHQLYMPCNLLLIHFDDFAFVFALGERNLWLTEAVLEVMNRASSLRRIKWVHYCGLGTTVYVMVGTATNKASPRKTLENESS